MIEADYLVVGAGAMGLAFADVVLNETDATLAIVDRYGSPGGHWTRAYPYVRLHQPHGGSYQHGDLSQVYPLARGTAPLIVALVGAIWLGESMTAGKTAAVAAIALGVIVMSRSGGSLDRLPRKALLYALGTACFTASYTLVDGVGARIAETASGYVLWMFAGDALGLTGFALATRGPGALGRLLPAWRSGIAAGGLSLGSYWIAIWAFTLAPLALVAALRETSVLFAMLIGVFLLGERANPWRWLSAGLILSGVVLMRL